MAVSVLREAAARVRLALTDTLTLGGLTAELAATFGDRPALRGDDPPRRWTHRQLEREVSRLAAAHEALGHRSGARVAIVLPNGVDVFLHVLALARAGAVAVPINARLAASQREVIVRVARATAVVDAALAARIGAWLAAHPDAALGDVGRRPAREVALVLCTSGTTGVPKAAPITSEGILAVARLVHLLPLGQARGPRAGRDRLLCALPLAHIMGLATLLTGLTAGFEVIHQGRFVAPRVLATIATERVNVFVGVPTMYADMDGLAQDFDLGSVQVWASAADAMPPERARRFQRRGALVSVWGRRLGSAVFLDVYGMVEMSGAMAVRFYASGARGAGVFPPAVGFVLPGFEARVVDEEGRALGPGRAGALEVRGRGVIGGYEAGEARPSGAWFATGDVARMWGRWFAFAGRREERLKLGGFSVFPAEVEGVLAAHPEAAEVALVGVPDARLGARPEVLVVPRSGAFDAAGFLAWAGERLAGYERPQRVHVVAALPRGPHGKLDRAAAAGLARGGPRA